MITLYKPENNYIEEREIGIEWQKEHVKNTLWFFSPAIVLFVLTTIFGWTSYYGPTDANPTGGDDVSILALIFYVVFAASSIGAIVYNCIEGKMFRFKNPSHINVSYFRPHYLDDEIYAEAYKDCIDEYKHDKELFDVNYWSKQFYELGGQLENLKAAQKRAKREEKEQIPRKNYADWMKERNEMYMKGLK